MACRLLVHTVVVGAMLMVTAAVPVPAVRRWEVPAIASPMWESHPAIDPRTGDLWFVRSDAQFSGWRILVSRCSRGGWRAPIPMPFAAPGLEADPFFTADGKTVWFIASHGSGAMNSAALDIWKATRDRAGRWFSPQRLPAPINSDAAEWFPRPGPDGWLYFGSARKGGHGLNDIWRARQRRDGKWSVENAGAPINSAGDEYEFQPSPDGRWALLSAGSGLYRLDRLGKGWGHKTALGPAVNATKTEIGPMILPDNRSFMFSRDSRDGRSGELFVAGTGRPHCRR